MSVVSDPIGDLLTRMRNAQSAHRTFCRAPWSRIKQELCNVLKQKKWIAEVKVLGEAPFQEIEVIFSTERPPLTIKRMSKPGQRVYRGKKELKPILQGHGIAVLTTSQGLMTDADAKIKNVGGEVLCTIY